ncbi:MAG: hypothetical protein E7487_00675 [Ruminococcaceae bacterium]|nr:hypothetical protein [Oscillospiraceae bacterium]
MKKTMPIAVAAILFSVIAAVLIAKLLFIPEDNGMNLEEKAAEAEDVAQYQKNKMTEEDELSEEPEETGFYIGGYEGELAVFRGESKEQPMMIFGGIYLHQLPEYDRRQLEEGIYVKDYQTLTMLLEDYIS